MMLKSPVPWNELRTLALCAGAAEMFALQYRRADRACCQGAWVAYECRANALNPYPDFSGLRSLATKDHLSQRNCQAYNAPLFVTLTKRRTDIYMSLMVELNLWRRCGATESRSFRGLCRKSLCYSGFVVRSPCLRVASLYVLVLSVLLSVPWQLHGQDHSSPKDRLLSEAPGKWVEYRRKAKQLQGTVTWTMGDPADPTRKWVNQRIELKQNQSGSSFLIQRLQDDSTNGTLDVLNAKYAFELRRESPDRPWAVGKIDSDLARALSPGFYIPKYFVAAMLDKVFSFATAEECLPELIKDPDFAVVNVVEPPPGEDSNHLRIQFTNRPKEMPPQDIDNHKIPGGWNSLLRGWVVLDPRHYWVMREFETQCEIDKGSVGTRTAKYEYKEGPDGFPIIARKVIRYYNGTSSTGSRLTAEEVNEFELTEQADVPESAFTLT